MYAVWLESCGYRVTVAPDAASARRIARTENVQVLVIDALFGAAARRAEITRRWSRLAHRDRLPIVVLSGYFTDCGRPPDRDRLVVFKPCLPQQLSGFIEGLLSPPWPSSAAASRDKGKHVVGCPSS